MDIDKMFKLPKLPASAGQKRKMPDNPNPEYLKKFKFDEAAPLSQTVDEPHLNGNGKGKGKGRQVTVQDEEMEEREERNAGGGGGGEVEDFYDDADDEGRFFGGGLNNEQEQILNIFDAAGEGEDGPVLDLPALRRQLGKFERTVTKNAEQRGKYPDDPSKFIESEADLDTSLKSFLPLTQNPPLFYPELVRAGIIPILSGLLAHENTDIAVDVVEVIRELTDEDVGEEEDAEGGAEEEERASKTRMAIGQLIDELLNNSLLDLLVSNLSRLNESEESDSQGVFHILAVFENLLSFMPPLASTITSETSLLGWLVTRLEKEGYDSNKQYASEVLAMLLQEGREVVLRFAKLDGLDKLLQVLFQYIKKDPGDGEELEFMENVFDCLCTSLAEPEMKQEFHDSEGVELMVMMMKEKRLARTRAIKVLDYALQSPPGAPSCIRFITASGLPTFFSAFMGKSTHKSKNRHLQTSQVEDEEHLSGILGSLFTNLESDSPERIRLIAKFVEEGYAKVERLLELREAAESRLAPVKRDIEDEKKALKAEGAGEEEIEEMEVEWYLRKMDAGLASLQNADYVLAWVVMEDDGAMTHARLLLSRKGMNFKNVSAVLRELKDNIGDDDEEENGEAIEGEEGGAALQRMILEQLIAFLEGL
ncbi:hypothetical protein L202_06717 [Cryptococcus amylolentus CBS 6039]|uniref:Beta-catenin-like protein 1 N-terminal domain-containing protein n=1 Tax=Cryptococcus amylolentus CBS 6039 TaxID=1295533 RepID=A0A1E3HGX3_9TREE|nr:hypothetical protein L202_06717 [Cryptococcus amylolentus CBS 6039]ODN75598.1 hypothetical protein L202_06717 [Cryptococcus amylolentus CBS 6039]